MSKPPPLRRFRRAFAWAPAILIAQAEACAPAQHVDPVADGRITPASAADTSATDYPGDAPAVVFLFDLDSRAEGPIGVGMPVRLVSEVEARLRVERAQISVVMPEVAAARASAWDEGYRDLPVGARYPAVDSLVTSMRPGAPVRLETAVTIPAPGYYHVNVNVSARALALDPVVREGIPLQDTAHHDFWIWIDERGGFAALEYDPTRLPLGADPSPGPLRYSVGTAPLRDLLERGRRDPRSRLVVRGLVQDSAGRPAAGTTVHLRAYVGECGARGAAEESVVTDERGRFLATLGSYHPREFAGCVALHADPAPGSGWSHAAARYEARFAAAPAPPDSLEVSIRLADAP